MIVFVGGRGGEVCGRVWVLWICEGIYMLLLRLFSISQS